MVEVYNWRLVNYNTVPGICKCWGQSPRTRFVYCHKSMATHATTIIYPTWLDTRLNECTHIKDTIEWQIQWSTGQGNWCNSVSSLVCQLFLTLALIQTRLWRRLNCWCGNIRTTCQRASIGSTHFSANQFCAAREWQLLANCRSNGSSWRLYESLKHGNINAGKSLKSGRAAQHCS